MIPRTLFQAIARMTVAAILAIPTQGGAVELSDGTPVRLRLTRNLSSANAQAGETVDFEVLEDVEVGNRLVIKRGGVALATVTEAQPSRRMGRAGRLNVNIDHVRLVTGDKVALRAVQEAKGGSNVGKMTGAIVATAIVFFPAAPLFLFAKGKDIKIPKGTEITAYVNGNVKLAGGDEAVTAERVRTPLVEPQAKAVSVANEIVEPPIQRPEKRPETKQTAPLAVSSDPTGADIEVDGAFVGSTPSTISLALGQHEIRVSKRDHVPVVRRISTG